MPTPDWIDKYDCAVNHPSAYQYVAETIQGGSVIVAWTDGRGTQLDLVFSRSYSHVGHPQGGMHRTGLIYIGVMRLGCFGFGPKELHGDYVSEKLNVPRGATSDALATFINGVFAALEKKDQHDHAH